MCISGRDAHAIGVYLTDLGHYKDVKRRFRQVREELGRGCLLKLVKKLPLEADERRYLREVIAGV
jgi:hypothetical protein